MVNNNNPTDINERTKSYSVIVPPLDNKLPYNYFGSANPEIDSRLPYRINLGLTSPGTIHKATACDGLDFINTNPDYDKIPFEYCLKKFGDHYQIPGLTFNNLLNNLPYTFSALTNEQKNSYLSKLKEFVNKESSKISGNKIEHFENDKKENYSNDCSDSKISLSGILCIIVIVVIVILFILFLAKKN